ncbi:MAG: mechanosensitive ion channel family protein [Nannocystis sp.]|nr:mechanosensitive ion channel family protein [Nannocystis sp.]MBA3546594.1 mechanosensitive ion channel family protein [Nannocystis sp.]
MIIETLNAMTPDPRLQALIVLLGSFVLAFFTELLFRSVLVIFVQNTKTELDDIIVANVRRPLFLSVLFLGSSWAASLLEPRAWLVFVLNATFVSISILLWTGALIRVCSAILHHVGRRHGAAGVLQPRTLPLFDMLAKILLFGAAVYLIMLAWTLDVTGWLASAGIVGIAVGFAAKDSLANLFAGIFIIADAPYKLGDFIMFEDGMRGRVTEIGLRATRILTRDDIEINIPNQLIGNSRVVNESAGPHERERVRVPVSVAYGSDIDLVRKVLLECPKGQPNICEEPRPFTQFQKFGDSGLDFVLCVWIHEPRYKDDVIDAMNTRIYKAFAAAEIEIPYAKLDVFIKTLPQLHAQLVAQGTAPLTAEPAGHLPVTAQTAAAQVAHALAQPAQPGSILSSTPRSLSHAAG